MVVFFLKISDKIAVWKMKGNKTALEVEMGGTMRTHNPEDIAL